MRAGELARTWTFRPGSACCWCCPRDPGEAACLGELAGELAGDLAAECVGVFCGQVWVNPALDRRPSPSTTAPVTNRPSPQTR